MPGVLKIHSINREHPLAPPEDAGRPKDTGGLVLDGWSPLEVMRDKILEAVGAGSTLSNADSRKDVTNDRTVDVG